MTSSNNFQHIAEKMTSHAEGIADVLMPMEGELPSFISQLSPMARFVAVGALWQTGNIPHEDVATALLFEPEHVGFATGDSREETQSKLEERRPAGAMGTDFITSPSGVTEVTEFGRMIRMSEHGDLEFDTTAEAERADNGTSNEEPMAEWERELLANYAAYTDLDNEIYQTSRSLIAEYPQYEAEIVRGVTAAGLDWPQGSGDYHGAKPFSQFTDMDRMRSLIEVYDIVGRIGTEHGSSGKAA